MCLITSLCTCINVGLYTYECAIFCGFQRHANISLLGRDICMKLGSGKHPHTKPILKGSPLSPFVDGFQDIQSYQNHQQSLDVWRFPSGKGLPKHVTVNNIKIIPLFAYGSLKPEIDSFGICDSLYLNTRPVRGLNSHSPKCSFLPVLMVGA